MYKWNVRRLVEIPERNLNSCRRCVGNGTIVPCTAHVVKSFMSGSPHSVMEKRVILSSETTHAQHHYSHTQAPLLPQFLGTDRRAHPFGINSTMRQLRHALAPRWRPVIPHFCRGQNLFRTFNSVTTCSDRQKRLKLLG